MKGLSHPFDRLSSIGQLNTMTGEANLEMSDLVKRNRTGREKQTKRQRFLSDTLQSMKKVINSTDLKAA